MLIELKTDVQVRRANGTWMIAKAGRKVNFFDKPRDGSRVYTFDVYDTETTELCRYIEVAAQGERPTWL